LRPFAPATWFILASNIALSRVAIDANRENGLLNQLTPSLGMQARYDFLTGDRAEAEEDRGADGVLL